MSAHGFASARHVFATDITQWSYKVKVLWWIGLTIAGAWLLAKTRFGNWIYSAGGDANVIANATAAVAQNEENGERNRTTHRSFGRLTVRAAGSREYVDVDARDAMRCGAGPSAARA